MVVQVRPDRHGFALVGAASWTPAAIAGAQLVLAEVNEAAPAMAAPTVPADRLDVVTFTARCLLDLPSRPSLPEEETVAGNVLPLLPFPCVLQYGPGRLLGAVVRRLVGERVSLRSGLITDDALGLLTTSHVGCPEATMVVGGRSFYDKATAAGVQLRPLEWTHDLRTLAGLPAFVALNTALEIDLSGDVNVEWHNGVLVGGVGGHPDFCLAAALSERGRSIIALTSRRDGRPTVVPRLRTPATTSGLDVEFVVTEHGVADLRAASPLQRARAIIGVAHPDDRPDLERQLPRSGD